MVGMKVCSKCGKEKKFSEFYTRKDGKGNVAYYRSWCIQCISDWSKSLEYGKTYKSKRCTKCKKTRRAKFFTADTKHKDGLSSDCVKCRVAYNDKLKIKFEKLGLCVWCGKNPARSNRKTCENCETSRRLTSQFRKLQVFEFYGGVICKCCGEQDFEFLTIDHINGGGFQHNKERKGYNIYQWLIKKNFPEGFQVLCWNCNCGKRNYAICPHRKKKKDRLTVKKLKQFDSRKTIEVATDKGQK
jgi:hypothetical protein